MDLLYFIGTGFHGLHVLIGSILNVISFIRIVTIQFSRLNYLSFELAIWYWHFVDVV